MYAIGYNTTDPPVSGWTTTIPLVSKGDFLWTRTIVTYSTGDSTTAYSVAYQGEDGEGAITTVQNVAPAPGSKNIDLTGVFVQSVNGVQVDASGNANTVLTPSAVIPIPSYGQSQTYNMAGLTASHEVVRWNFRTSNGDAIAENNAPCDLSITTNSGYFTITNNSASGSPTETVQPVFSVPVPVTTT